MCRDGRAGDDQRLAEAMITNSACRSAMWPTWMSQVRPLAACVANRSVRIASTQISGRIEDLPARPRGRARARSPTCRPSARSRLPVGRRSAPSRRGPGGQTEDAHDEVGDREPGGRRRGTPASPRWPSRTPPPWRPAWSPNDHVGRVGRVERPGELRPRPPDHPEQDQERSTPSGVRFCVSA